MYNNQLIEKLNRCAALCEYCADQCLEEDDIAMMVDCIRIDRDCADICSITAAFVARQSDLADKMMELCADLCRQCGDECAKHEMEHCQDCAAICRECEEACKSYVQ